MASTDLLTLAEAKAAINQPSGDTSQDTEIAAWVTAVSLQLDKLCGPIVNRTVTSESHDGGGHTLYLKQRPVASVTEVKEFSGTTATTLTAESTSSQPGTAYLLETAKGVLRRRSGGGDASYPRGRQNVVVTYTAGRGYTDSSSVDERFKTGARLLLAHLWRREQGAGTETFGSVPAFPGVPGFGLPNVVRDLLAEDIQAPEV